MTDSKQAAEGGPEGVTEGGAEVLGPGQGVRFTARGSAMFFKAIADHDSGDFSLMERTLPAGGRRPPAHRHTNCSEAYFVLDGTVSVSVKGADLSLGPEDFLLVPRGTAHTFGNSSGSAARLLVIHAPAMDAYFAELHDLWGRGAPPTQDEERSLMARFGMTPA
jgi:mannose-6-phosphate isomerase-like protein (cupin superfamily)